MSTPADRLPPSARNGHEVNPRLPELMTAIVQERYGDDPSAVLTLGQIPVPQPRPGQVLVRVEAAGVDRGVWHLTTGRPYAIRVASGIAKPKRPVPGLDFAGTVVGVGEGVTEHSIGDPVFGSGTGTYATYAVASSTKVFQRPESLGVADAAALPGPGCAALQAVRDQARLTAGSRVLIIGASGGVGSYAVQLAAAAGAEVTGVARGANCEFVRHLGARATIDHTSEEIDARGGGYDAVIDIAGVSSLPRNWRSMPPSSGPPFSPPTMIRRPRAASTPRSSWRGRLPFVGQHLGGMFSRTTRGDLAALTAAVETGDLRAAVTRSYTLADAGRALTDLANGRIQGKAVITTANP